MTASYCDWEPCTWLQKFVTDLMPKDVSPDTVQIRTMTPLNRCKKKTAPVQTVTFYYCPFCGTRLSGNKEILEWVHRHQGRQREFAVAK